MRLQTLAIAGLLVAAAGADAADEKAARSYRWVDDKGVVHYGDYVPPDATRSQASELNRQGIEMQRTPAQLTPGEAQSAGERAAAAARDRQRDQVLLSTYVSVKDIEQLRDERLALIEGQVVAAKGFLAGAAERMKGLQQRALAFSPYAATPNARRMPDALAEEIVRTINEERSQQAIMEQRQKEQSELRARFQSDIERYQQLMAQRAAAATR